MGVVGSALTIFLDLIVRVEIRTWLGGLMHWQVLCQYFYYAVVSRERGWTDGAAV